MREVRKSMNNEKKYIKKWNNQDTKDRLKKLGRIEVKEKR